ncbi:MAG: GAF domain-containing sensor histidine kinase [Labilithrix sp.]|nr:GAF domain-containing sensor histidine kinase [Labilithrix sp.]
MPLALASERRLVNFSSMRGEEESTRGGATADERRNEVLLELSALDKSAGDAIRRIITLDAETLRVERVSYWSWQADPPALRCEEGYELSPARYGEHDTVIAESRYPRYFRALRAEQVIAAEDARRDQRTSELADDYLAPRGIGAMLDIPVWVGGELAGVLCHEWVGPPHRWPAAEVELAISMGQLVATALEVRRRNRLEEILRVVSEQSARLVESEKAVRDELRARDEFLSVASHELSTPLAALQLALDALRTTRLSPDDTTRSLAVLDRQVKRLSQLVTTLLDVSRVRTGHFQLSRERFDLGELTREVCGRFADGIAASGSTLSLENAAPVVGNWDRSRIDQVVTNLLSNAVKFGSGKPIEIRVGLDDRGQAKLTMRDHGIGIPRMELERIFERFERAVSTRSYGGLGLGLFIARAIVEAHCGRITAESVAKEGTSFTVHLPLDVPFGCEPTPGEAR